MASYQRHAYVPGEEGPKGYFGCAREKPGNDGLACGFPADEYNIHLRPEEIAAPPREPDLVLRHEDQGRWLLLSSPGRLSVHATMAHLRERLADLGYTVEKAGAESPLTVRAGRRVKPRPWTSPALLQPWPDAAAYLEEVRDAEDRSVFSGDWAATCEAWMYVVCLVNEQHRREQNAEVVLTSVGDGGG